MVNRCSPCKMRDAFSGVPATKKFFMDRLHLLDFLGKGLCRFPVKNDTAAISRFYHVSIGIVSSLSAKHDIFRMGESVKMPPWGSPAAAEIKGLGQEKTAGAFPAARVIFCRPFQKWLSSSICSIISSTLQCRILHSLSIVLVCTFLFFRNLSSWERFTLWYV